jgi:hypothetical protein
MAASDAAVESGSSWTDYFSASVRGGRYKKEADCTKQEPKSNADQDAVWNANDMFRHFGLNLAEPESPETTSLSEEIHAFMEATELSDEAFTARTRALLGRFLQLETPKVTDTMQDFFLIEGAFLSLLIDILTFKASWRI